MTSIIVVKDIKPARLKEGAFRLELLNAMRKEATQIKADFRETTATWEHKPEFVEEVSLTGPGPVMLVGTDDEIYGYVDEGTKPHIIMARNAKVLAFNEGYSAKTKPGFVGSYPGGSYGAKVFRPFVNHPGTEARRFSNLIAKRWEPKFKRAMEDAMGRAAKKSGHGG